MRLLVIEDDDKVAAFIEEGLRREGHAVDVLHRGDGAAAHDAAVGYDAVVLDVMLPGPDQDCRNAQRPGPRDMDADTVPCVEKGAAARRRVKVGPRRDDLRLGPGRPGTRGEPAADRVVAGGRCVRDAQSDVPQVV